MKAFLYRITPIAAVAPKSVTRERTGGRFSSVISDIYKPAYRMAGAAQKKCALLLVLLLTAVPSFASASVQVEGVRFPRAVDVGKERFILKGYGLLRYLVFIKAYAGALYLPDGAESMDVLGPVAKRLELEYFHAIKSEDFAKATRKKIRDNITAAQATRFQSRIDQLADMYRDVRPGDRYALTFIPGEGTRLTLNGETLGTIPGEGFARAVFSIWLGTDPIDRNFRNVLLGGS